MDLFYFSGRNGPKQSSSVCLKQNSSDSKFDILGHAATIAACLPDQMETVDALLQAVCRGVLCPAEEKGLDWYIEKEVGKSDDEFIDLPA